MDGAVAFLSLWSHAIAALLFGAAALIVAQRGGRPAMLLVALAATAIWAVTVAGAGVESDPARIGESLRNLAWLAFMAALLRIERAHRPAGLIALYLAVAGVMVANIAVTLILSNAADHMALPRDARHAAPALRMVAATGALFLLHQLYGVIERTTMHGPVRVALWALAAMWLYDFNLYALSRFGDAFPADVAGLRGLAMIAVGAAFLLAVHRGSDWRLQLSRQVTVRTLSMALLAGYVAAMLVATSAIGAIGGEAARIAQTAFVFGSGAAVLALLPRGRLRAWFRVKIAKHLFQHRYDYRAEWTRFTETLGKPEDAAAPLPERVVKAVADITLSPAGLLYLPDGDQLAVAAAWNWPDADVPGAPLAGTLGRYMFDRQRIVELDAARRDAVAEAELALIPQAMIDCARAWAMVPLIHGDRLAGVVVLARPPVARSLDWEDFDLLRVVGQQIASYLAERQSQRALDDARRFDEFNRRFAFVMHDIKNLVSQLSLVARNAERHADNPAFRQDMVETLRESAARMNALLERLSQHNSAVPEDPRAVPLVDLVSGIVAGFARQHPVELGRAAPLVAVADPARLEKLLGHLIQNAVEASGGEDGVRVELRETAGQVAIDIIDRGCGMTPEFIREKLFAPFASTKAAGFGIGAHEARQLAQAMGGTIEVTSRVGEGTRFTVLLPRARGGDAAMLEEAA